MPPSKQVTDRQKDALAVVASVDTHAAGVADGLATVLGPHLRDGESMPDLALTLALIGRAIDARTDAMTEAETQHQTELADDVAPRNTRDEASARLSSAIVDLREMLDGVYGHAAIVRYGISGVTPRDATQLAAFAASLALKLETDPLPQPRFGATLDRVQIARELRERAEPLDRALSDVAREAREAEGTLIARDQTIEAYDRMFGRGANALTALYRLGEQDELAARVRPSGRRPGRLATEEEPDPTVLPSSDPADLPHPGPV